MRNPSQVLLLAVLMASLILPPGLVPAGAAVSASAGAARARSVLLVGDSLSIGLGQQLEAVFASRGDVRFAHLGKVSSGLANPGFFDWNAQLTAQVKAHHPDVVLIMLGANDDKPLPGADGRSAAFGSKAWDAAYAERLARLHAIARAENPRATVYFIGVPVMGDPSFNALMVHVNGVIAATAASLPDCAFIDVKDTLADAKGRFAPLARVPDGGVVKLRAADGVHISGTGSRLLAARCLDVVSDAAGLPKKDLLAAVADRDAQPMTGEAAVPVRLAETRRPAAEVRPVAAAKAVAALEAKPVATAKAVAAVEASPAVATKAVAVEATAPVVATKAALAEAKPVVAKPVVLAETRATPTSAVTARENRPTPAQPAKPAPLVLAEAPAQPAPRVTAVAAVPVLARPAPAPATAAGAYTVADGDTLWSVAKRLGVSADALAGVNPGLDPRRMSIGQSLALPAGANLAAVAKAEAAPARGAAARPAASVTHVVADGDNFWNVAKRHDVTVAALTQANPGVDPTRLRIGQELALPGSATAEAPAAPGPDGRYVVADGDNLWSIAHRLGIDVDRLSRANTSVNPLRLQPGQVLTLPGAARAEFGRAKARASDDKPAAQGLGEAALYPVAPGDTLWGLARRFGVDLEALLAVNSEIDPIRLRVGQLVTIPGGESMASAEALVFPVSPGDTLWSIARRFDVSVEALVAANPGVDPLRLREGQSLRVPSSLAAVAASGAPRKDKDTAATPTLAPAAARPAEAPAAARPAEAPAAAPTALDGPARVHTVSEGDTLWDLARSYGVRVSAILSENPGLDPVRLHVGQAVRLPGGTVAMAAR
ncbi:MAG: DUF459 domain-containing protein [Solidesulfovibrio sp. DCME]|uniref:DUF459 domain-containing protein n=1 Tax=Solidesulfovibrio sp. DCME TaxID=3447380 RepID=UPI003D13F609